MAQDRDQLSILENEDIFRYVLSEWLTPRDLVYLDQALPRNKREVLHTTMRKIPLAQPFSGNQEKWWTHHKQVFEWMVTRGLVRTKGTWTLHDKLWNNLIASGRFNSILEAMECVRFENFNKNFDLNQFAVFRNVKHLKLYNLDGGSIVAPTEVIFPQLETLHLQNCAVTASLLTVFARCEHLHDVAYVHNEFGGMNNISAEDRRAIAPFFDRMSNFSLSAGVNTVLPSHFPQGNLPQLRTVVLDNIQRNENNTEVLSEFVPRLTEVTNLTITRCRFNFAIVFNKIRESCPQLAVLHLNHDRWLRADNELEPDTPAVNASDKLTTLKLSTPLPFFDADFAKLLNLCGNSVRHLQLSFCARLTTNAYSQISRHLPQLQSLVVEYSREDGYFNADHQQELQNCFSHLRKLLVVEWQTWLPDNLKESSADKRTVMLEVPN